MHFLPHEILYTCFLCPVMVSALKRQKLNFGHYIHEILMTNMMKYMWNPQSWSPTPSAVENLNICVKALVSELRMPWTCNVCCEVSMMDLKCYQRSICKWRQICDHHFTGWDGTNNFQIFPYSKDVECELWPLQPQSLHHKVLIRSWLQEDLTKPVDLTKSLEMKLSWI